MVCSQQLTLEERGLPAVTRRIEAGTFCAALLFFAEALSSRRGQQVPQLHLQVTDTAAVPGTYANATLNALRCDASGNVYLRFYDPGAVFQAPVVRVSADGESKQIFSLDAVQGFRDADITAFAVAPDGSVVLAVWGPKVNDANILSFKSDGTFEPDATIEMGSRDTYQMALFSNGNILASGTQDAAPYGKDGPTVSTVFTQVLDGTGRVVKDLTLPGDYSPPKPSEPEFKKTIGRQPAEITLGDAVSASDGNVYLARHFGDLTIYVIASDGSLVRKLTLKPPTSSAQAHGGIHFSAEGGGQLAVLFSVPTGGLSTGGRLISIYSATTGDRLIDYDAPRQVGAGLACYTPNGLTFIASTKQHQFEVNRVRPE